MTTNARDLASLLGAAAAPSSDAGALDTQTQAARIVSASSSVVSSSSNSTRRPAPHAGAGGGDTAIKSLMEQLSSSAAQAAQAPVNAGASEVKKEDGAEASRPVKTEPGSFPSSAPAPNASAPGPDASATNGPSSTSNPTMVMQMGAPPHPVAEFLFQLTKMLTDDNSRYIEWRNASIFVHDPPGLEKDILPKYFRHSNYSSFQRQMNYFGFRKIAGKGKMAPCSYVNEAAKEDISSLLFIKRKKTGVSSAAAKLMAQQNRLHRSMGAAQAAAAASMGAGNPLMASSMMGGALNPALGNASLMNNFGLMGGLPGMAAGGAAYNNSMNQGPLNEASILREQQQNVLAQLQQAHASALTNNPMPAMGGMGGMNQAQAKRNVGGLMANGASNAAGFLGNDQANLGGLLTTDQGNIYTNSNDTSAWGGSPADASLLIQQAAGGLAGGNFPQGAGAGDSNNFNRIDSAANLRALINQQISMFNTSAPGDAFPAGMAQQAQSQAPTSQQAQGLGNAGQGLPYEWNEMLQRMGGAAGVDNSAQGASFRQMEQLLQGGGGNAAPGPAASGQPFNLNGLLGASGAGVPQGFQ